MFTCVIRYRVEPGKLAEFREYAHAWIGLIRKYGGTHHGYFAREPTTTRFRTRPSASLAWAWPRQRMSRSRCSASPARKPTRRYRAAVAEDEGCKAATARFNETRCFSGYERSFLTPIFD